MKAIRISIRKNTRLARLLVTIARRLAGSDEIHTTVLGRTIYTLRHALPAETLTHELIHLAQMAETGRLRWTWHYYVTERAVPYRQKTAEVEAYFYQHDRGYLARRYPRFRYLLEDK